MARQHVFSGWREVALGSAGATAMAVVLGQADVYAHSGGQHEWDSTAPVAAAGLHVSRIDGSPPRWNQPNPYLLNVSIIRPELAEAVIDACTEETQ